MILTDGRVIIWFPPTACVAIIMASISLSLIFFRSLARRMLAAETKVKHLGVLESSSLLMMVGSDDHKRFGI